jgi:N6-adenosine-specific RNA methylase IME4
MQLPLFDDNYPEPSVTLAGNLDTLAALVASGQRYACILADPPWQFADRGARGAAAKHYETLPLEAIRALPVAPLALPKAHLHLWVPNAFVDMGIQVVRAWGFEYKNMLTWEKPGLGAGWYWRCTTEQLLLGVRGNLRFQDKSLRNHVTCKRGKHSRKPDQIRVLIEKASPAPRIELFGREAVPGWTVWGNQIDPTLFG